MRAATPQEHADHNHDHRKNHIPVDAHTVALLARASTTSFDEAVAVIQSFADVTAGAAALKAIEESHKRTMEIIDA